MATAKNQHVHTLIVGGGLTGLATAYGLEQRGHSDYRVVEAQPRPGGLCASTCVQGYTLDFGGHLLHLHTPTGQQLLTQLLANRVYKHPRHAFIYTQGLRVPYPFQTNLWALPPRWQAHCLDTLPQAAATAKPASFEQWCLAPFGSGLYETFFRPYNQKLWGQDLRTLTCEWCGPFIPAPNRREIRQSAQGPLAKAQGYNAHFYYPHTGGCGALVNALAGQIKHFYPQTALTALDLARKTAQLNHRETLSFDHLVSTIPLPQLVAMLQGQEAIKQQARVLRAQAVTVYHLAIARPVPPFSWIYFPDASAPFYRVGLQSGFSPANAPQGTSLFYIELPGAITLTPGLEATIWQALCQYGLVTPKDRRIFSHTQVIPHAYVIFDKARAQVLPRILSQLEDLHCYCAGRYGRWEYSFMEKSLLDGLELAKKLLELV